MTKKLLSILSVGILTCSIGCKISPPQVMKDLALPEHFTKENTDSTSLGDLPWKQLFHDPRLVKLIDTALQNNQDLLQSLQRLEIARNEYFIRKAKFRPQVDAQVSAGFDHYGKYTMTGVGNFDTNLSGNIDKDQRVPVTVTPEYFVGLRSTWEIDLWGKLRNQKQAAYADFLATQKGIRLVKTRLVAEVASRYYELLALDQELDIIKSNILLQDSAFELVQVQKMAGRVNELAVQQFKAQLLNTKALEGSVLSRTTMVENELNALQGLFPAKIARDTIFFETITGADFSPGIPSMLLQRRPDIQQARLELEAATFGLQATKAAFFPSLRLTPYMGLNTFNAAFLMSGSSLAYGLLGGLTTPFIYHGALKAQKEIASSRRIGAHLRYQKTVVNAMREVVNQLSEIRNLQNVYRYKAEEAETLNKAVETSNLLFKTGFASYLEVITAQRSVINAQLELVNTRKEMLFSVISLYEALGGGWK